MSKANIFDLDFEELSEIVLGMGESGYRTKQIWEGLYHQFWSKPESFRVANRIFRGPALRILIRPEGGGAEK